MKLMAIVILSFCCCNSVLAQQVYKINIKNHVFVPNVITVKANEEFKLEVKNEDAATEEFESKKMNIEKFIGPNKTLKLTLGPLAVGEYDFFGEFHQDTAQGKLIAK